MNRYSKKSEGRLLEAHPLLQDLFRRVLRIIDHSILAGHRDQAAQAAAFLVGTSRLKWPKSKHNSLPSLAVDAMPFPVDFKDIPRLCYFAGIVMGVADIMGLKVRWGGDLSRNNIIADEDFFDGAHFELRKVQKS